ncbi:MAG TPA: FtsQ-type POTRA domain-containing protein [Burkholderiales bacterium]
MWDNPRILNLAAGALVGIAAFVFAVAGLVLLLRSPLFPIREVDITSAPKHTTRAEIETAVRERIGGNFFAVSADAVREGLEKLPWVRAAAVRRVWPDRLEVSIEEHVAFARWGDDALVNPEGERFFGKSKDPLPLLAGPPGTEREVTSRYRRFAEIVAPLGTIERVVLTRRLAWQLRLVGGLDIVLGRDGDLAEQRLRRFVSVYDVTLKQMPQRHDYVDLRYPNGFALRVPEPRS